MLMGLFLYHCEIKVPNKPHRVIFSVEIGHPWHKSWYYGRGHTEMSDRHTPWPMSRVGNCVSTHIYKIGRYFRITYLT